MVVRVQSKQGKVLANSHQSFEAGYSFVFDNHFSSIVNGAVVFDRYDVEDGQQYGRGIK